MRTQFSRLSSSHISLLRLVERKLQTGFGNELPSETEFAWLPADIAWAFCSDALRRRSNCQYLAFHEAHKGLIWTRLPGEYFHCRYGFSR